MTPPEDAKVENAVIFGAFRLSRVTESIHLKFGKLVYIIGLLQCATFGRDHFVGGHRSPPP